MTVEDIDGGLHPAVDGQSLDEDEDESFLHILESLNPTPMFTYFLACETDTYSCNIFYLSTHV